MADRYNDLTLHRGTSHHDEIETLQRDLHELGFWIVGGADGQFGRGTQWALREFQIYASMAQVAMESNAGEAFYADRLSSAPTGAQRYSGPISGTTNADTRAALEHWLDNRWRCPVVVEAWKMSRGKRKRLQKENIWRYDDVASASPRMYALDLSDHFPIPDERSDEDGRIVLGDFQKYLSWSGPRSVPPRHTWPEGELLPEALVGKTLEELDAAERSTFKVVRAVSEVECIGYFDSVNSYDNAFVSLGPCHWTLGIASNEGNISEGELCGYLAYLAHVDPDAFEKAFGAFGLRIDESWVNGNGQPNGAQLFKSGSRKYAGWVAVQRDDGGFQRLPEEEREGNYLKTWHWFYRFSMAGRTIPGYRRRMWDMARIRLRDIGTLPWDSGSSRTVADVFTSEKARAMILRWHIRAPADMARHGRAGAKLKDSLARARNAAPNLNWNADPESWGDQHEKTLVAAIKQEAGSSRRGGLKDTIARVDSWPSWATGSNPRAFALDKGVGSLSEKRGSFGFDGGGLPPAP